MTLTAEKNPQKTAVVYLGTRYSYGRVRKMAERFAASLAALGFSKGDRIVMYIPNCVQFVVTWLGIQRVRAVAVPIAPIYKVPDVTYIANDTEAKAIVCSDRNYGYVKQALPDTGLEKIIVTNLADLLPLWKRAFGWVADKVPRGKVDQNDQTTFLLTMVSGSNPPAPDAETSLDDVAEVIYTGETTKHPKGVPITHGLFLVSSDEQLGVRDPPFPKDADEILGGAPLFHILGQTCSLSTLVVGGGTLVIHPKVNLDASFNSIQANRATSIIGVPAFYRMILEHDRVDHYDLSSLKSCFSGGDVLPLEVPTGGGDALG